jgi:hypothetical protein
MESEALRAICADAVRQFQTTPRYRSASSVQKRLDEVLPGTGEANSRYHVWLDATTFRARRFLERWRF